MHRFLLSLLSFVLLSLLGPSLRGQIVEYPWPEGQGNGYVIEVDPYWGVGPYFFAYEVELNWMAQTIEFFGFNEEGELGFWIIDSSYGGPFEMYDDYHIHEASGYWENYEWYWTMGLLIDDWYQWVLQ